MCGINGLVFLKGVERDNQMMAKIRFVFDELMVETQARGEHATGLASFKRDGSYEFHKKDINADTMTTEDKDYRSIVSNLNAEESSVVIAHTRYLTKGKASNNDNNHPFDIGNIVGLHNGSAKNDDELFKKYKDDFNRVGEVDSEIVFQLINHYNKDNITKDGLSKALEDTRLKGLFALAFLHKSNSSMLHLIKQDKPMHLAYWKEAGIIIFNSIDEHIEKAFRKLERVGQSFGIQNTVSDVAYLEVTSDRYFTIDADATEVEDAISEYHKFYIETSAKTWSSYGNYGYGNTGYNSTTTTNNTKTNTKNTPSYETVTAQDSQGTVLQGEIDTVTGEVIIWSDEVNDADDGSGLLDDQETCAECSEWMTEEEIDASYNGGNPKGERVCSDCYQEVMESFMSEADLEEHKIAK